MVLNRATLSFLLPPVVLAAVTLGVFAQLREFGPASAIRRFHEAVMRRDEAAIRGLTVESPPQAISFLANTVSMFEQHGYRYDILGSAKAADRVVVEVVYTPQKSGARAPSLWVLERRPHGWLINPQATLEATQRAFFGYGP